MQPARVVGSDWRAHDAAAIADDEGHLFRRAERLAGADQIAFVLAIVVVRDDDEVASGDGLDGVGDGEKHVESIGRRRRGVEKIVRRDGALRLGHDPAGGFTREPRAVLAADQRDRAGRNADPAGEIRAGHLIALEPVAELHGC